MGRVLLWSTLWLFLGVGQVCQAAAQTLDSTDIWHDRAPLDPETNLFILNTQPLQQPNLRLDTQLQALDLIATPPARLNSEASEQPIKLVTATASPSSATLPSFWWTQTQIGRRLVENWGAANNLVDVFVNPQVWSLLNYSERYAFINQFATTAQSYGYNVRVYDRQPNLLATYICGTKADLPEVRAINGTTLAAETPTQAANCNVCLDSLGNCGFNILFRPVAGLPARVPDTADK